MPALSLKIKNVKKTDNHPRSEADKIAIRRNVLAAVSDARVFDACAGSGRMFNAVWKDAAAYVGCDTRLFMDNRLQFVADNRRVLRSIDLDQFNVFDVDTYGSPWHQLLIIAARRTVKDGETIGLCITEGSGLNLRQGGIPNALRLATGLTGKVAGVNRNADELIDAALVGLCRRMNCKIERRWQACGHTGAQMRYIGLILRGYTSAAKA